jgi:hypothetical protein
MDEEAGKIVPAGVWNYSCIVRANNEAVREFFASDLAEIGVILFDTFRVNKVFPYGPYYQVRILERQTQKWMDPDGKPADHPDGWLNVEVRIQCGRGIL